MAAAEGEEMAVTAAEAAATEAMAAAEVATEAMAAAEAAIPVATAAMEAVAPRLLRHALMLDLMAGKQQDREETKRFMLMA